MSSNLQRSLAAFLDVHQMSNRAFARMAGISETAVRSFLSGRIPRVDTLHKIAKALDMDVTDLIDNDQSSDGLPAVELHTGAGAFSSFLALHTFTDAPFFTDLVEKFVKAESPIDQYKYRLAILKELDKVLDKLKEGEGSVAKLCFPDNPETDNEEKD